MKHISIFLLLFISVLILSCNQNNDTNKQPIAKIHDNYLYLSDIREIIPNNKTEEDSLLIAKNYINNWIKKQLLLKKAELNLPEGMKNVEKEIEDYRSSLLIYRYQQQLIDQKLDTVVDESEMRNYYEENKSNFILDQVLVKATYIKLPINSPNIDNVKKWYKSDDEEHFSRLEDYCYQYAEIFDNFNGDWVPLNRINNIIPKKIKNPKSFLKYNKHIESEDSLNLHLIKINDYRLKGTEAPFNFVEDKINSLILNKRKHQLLEKLEKDIYNEALNHKEFKIY